MDWRVKALIQKILSSSNIGDKLNHMGTRLLNPAYLSQKVDYHIDEALIHHERLRKNGYEFSGEDVFLELGTGYAIVESLTMTLLGAGRVVTVDITADITFAKSLRYVEMFSDAHIGKIAKKSRYSEKEIREKLASLKKSRNLEEFLEKAGIEYIAPYTISDLQRFAGKINVCYSQVVLEHIPESVLNELFAESGRFLAEGGYHSHIANLTDHFRNPGFFRDNKVTDVNFLRYSNEYWNFWCGNDIAYVNRLRFPYYLRLFTTLGFEILEIDKQKEKDRMNELLSYDEIHDDIKSKYDRQELMDSLWIQRFHIICKKGGIKSAK